MIEMTWRRSSNAQRLEDIHDSKSRHEAVESILNDAGNDPVWYEYRNPKRQLGGATGALFEVCRLVVENPEWAALIYWHLTRDDSNEVEIDDEIEGQLQSKLKEMDIEE